MRDFGVAGFSGVMATVIMAPVFNVNVSMNKTMAKIDMKPHVHKKDSSFFTHASKLIKEKGIKELFKVNPKALLSSFWFQGISFSTKNTLQNLLNFTRFHDGFLRTFLANTLSGTIGGITALTAVFPFNYPRVMLAQMKSLKDYYRNFNLYLVTVAIYRGLYFGVFDSIKTNS